MGRGGRVVMPAVVRIGGGSYYWLLEKRVYRPPLVGTETRSGRWVGTRGRMKEAKGLDNGRALSGLRTIRERRSSHRHALASSTSPIKTRLPRGTVRCKVLEEGRALFSAVTAFPGRVLAFFASYGISLSATDAKHRANVDVRLSICGVAEDIRRTGWPGRRAFVPAAFPSGYRAAEGFGAGPFLGEHAMGGRYSRVAGVFVLFNIELPG